MNLTNEIVTTQGTPGGTVLCSMPFLDASFSLHVYVCVHMCEDTCVCTSMWTPALHVDPPELPTFFFFFSHLPGTCQVGRTGWPVSPKDPPVCPSPAVRSQAHTTIPWCLCRFRALTQALLVSGQALDWQNHLPAPGVYPGTLSTTSPPLTPTTVFS